MLIRFLCFTVNLLSNPVDGSDLEHVASALHVEDAIEWDLLRVGK